MRLRKLRMYFRGVVEFNNQEGTKVDRHRLGKGWERFTFALASAYYRK